MWSCSVRVRQTSSKPDPEPPTPSPAERLPLALEWEGTAGPWVPSPGPPALSGLSPIPKGCRGSAAGTSGTDAMRGQPSRGCGSLAFEAVFPPTYRATLCAPSEVCAEAPSERFHCAPHSHPPAPLGETVTPPSLCGPVRPTLPDVAQGRPSPCPCLAPAPGWDRAVRSHRCLEAAVDRECLWNALP